MQLSNPRDKGKHHAGTPHVVEVRGRGARAREERIPSPDAEHALPAQPLLQPPVQAVQQDGFAADAHADDGTPRLASRGVPKPECYALLRARNTRVIFFETKNRPMAILRLKQH